MRKKKQGSVGQRPATKQAYQNERRVKKKIYARREEDSNQNKTEERRNSRRQRGPALGGHGARYAVRRPPSWEQEKRMLTFIDHIIL
jgi:hypothetical protein